MTPLNEQRAAKVKDLLYRKGQRDTVEIANYLSISTVAARRLLLAMTDAGVLDIWAGRGSGSNANIFNLKDQREPLDAMTRLKEGYSEAKTYVLHCKRLLDVTPEPQLDHYDVEVVVVPQAKTGAAWRAPISEQTRWRAYCREWGASNAGYGDPRSAAIGIASKVAASVVSVEEVADVYAAHTTAPASPGELQDA